MMSMDRLHRVHGHRHLALAVALLLSLAVHGLLAMLTPAVRQLQYHTTDLILSAHLAGETGQTVARRTPGSPSPLRLPDRYGGYDKPVTSSPDHVSGVNVPAAAPPVANAVATPSESPALQPESAGTLPARPMMDYLRQEGGGSASAPESTAPVWYQENQVDRAPRAIRPLQPKYPWLARKRGVEGAVVVQLKVDESGEVRECEVIASEPKGVFEQAVQDSCRTARFTPAQRNGSDVRVFIRVKVRFQLEETD